MDQLLVTHWINGILDEVSGVTRVRMKKTFLEVGTSPVAEEAAKTLISVENGHLYLQKCGI